MNTNLLTNKVKRGISYGRVSTHEPQSLNEQQHINRQWMDSISRRSNCVYEIVLVLNEAESTTGKNDDRPVLIALKKHVISKTIDFVVVKGIDRLNRKTADFINFVELCKENGVELYINGLDVDLSTPAGMMVVQMLAVIAEMEGKTIIQRSVSSIRSLQRTKGKINGGPALLGYDIDHTVSCTRSINENKAKDVVFIFDTFIEQKDIHQTLKKLKQFNIRDKKGNFFKRDSLIRLLKNPIYNGRLKITGSDDYKEIPTKIISDEKFYQASTCLSDLLERHKYTYKSQKRIYPLTGLLVNSDGNFYKGTSGKGRNNSTFYYYIERTTKTSFHCADIENIVINSIKYFLEKAELSKYRMKVNDSLVTEIAVLKRGITTTIKEIETISKKMTDITNKMFNIDGLHEEFIKHIESTFLELSTQKVAKEKVLNDLKETLHQKEAAPTAIDNVENFLNTNKNFLDLSSSLDSQRSFFRKIFNKVVINKNTNEIKLFWNHQISQEELKIPLELKLSCSSRQDNIAGKFMDKTSDLYSKLHDLTVVKKETGITIAKQLGVSRTTVIHYQKKFGLQVRPSGANRKRTRGLAFGYKSLSNGKMIINHEEQKIIHAIKIWKSEGKTFREIANILNTQKAKTKTGNGRWHAKTIHQIFSRNTQKI